MPVIHIELKKSGVPVSQAYHQIEKYSGEGIFSGLFSLVQIFVAMEPNETVYFANPGPDGKFNPDYYFHWADYIVTKEFILYECADLGIEKDTNLSIDVLISTFAMPRMN